MSVTVSWNGVNYTVPSNRQPAGWGTTLTAYLESLGNNGLSKVGGTFTLTADVNFGATYGVLSAYFSSRTAATAAAGLVRLANTETVSWRNAANSADLAFTVNSSDLLEFNGFPLTTLALGTAHHTLSMNAGGTATEYALLDNTNIAASGTADIALNKLAATTASKAVETDASGYLVASTTTTTELALLAGVSALIDDPLTTRGDIVTRGASAPGRLAVGAADSFLSSDGTDPSWVDLNTAVTATKIVGQLASTGLFSGGVLSIGTPTTTFTVTDGTGVIVDNTTTPGVPVVTNVSWTGKTNVAATELATGIITYVGINAAGTIVQQNTKFTNIQTRTIIVWGVLVHTDLAAINAVNQEQLVALSPVQQSHDLANAIGFFNVTGNKFSASGADLTIDKSAGDIHALGSNYSTSALNPNVLTVAASTDQSFQYRFQDGTNGTTDTTIDPDIYDLAGVSTAVANNKFTVQRIYLFLSGDVKVQPGQNIYSNEADAIAGIGVDAFITEPSILANGLLRGFLVVKKGTTDLTDSNTTFIEAEKFGSTIGAGGVATTTIQGAYDNSSTPEMIIDATRGALTVQDAASPLGVPIFEVKTSAGASTAFAVSTASISGDCFLDEDNMASDSAAKLASQQSIKAYVDAQVLASGSITYVDKSADYTVLDADGYETIGVTTGSSTDKTITLPTASANANREITIKKVDSGTNDVIIDGEGAETIDGVTTKTLSGQYDSMTLKCDGDEWHVVTGGLATSTAAGLVYKVANKVTLSSADITTTSTSLVDLTGATITLVLPTASRVAFAFTGAWINSTVQFNFINVMVDSTLQFGTKGVAEVVRATIGWDNMVSVSGITDELAAGSHTIKIQWGTDGGTATMRANSAASAVLSAWTI